MQFVRLWFLQWLQQYLEDVWEKLISESLSSFPEILLNETREENTVEILLYNSEDLSEQGIDPQTYVQPRRTQNLKDIHFDDCNNYDDEDWHDETDEWLYCFKKTTRKIK